MKNKKKWEQRPWEKAHPWMTEEFTPKKIAGLAICFIVLALIGHFMSCEFKGEKKHHPKTCKIATSIVGFVYRLDK